MRAVLLIAMVLELLVFAVPSRADEVKSAKECNQELRQRKKEIFKAGETWPEFMNDCWWHSKPGIPTAIRSRSAEPTVAAPKTQESTEVAKPSSKTPKTSKIEVRLRRSPKAEVLKAGLKAKTYYARPYYHPPTPKTSIYREVRVRSAKSQITANIGGSSLSRRSSPSDISFNGSKAWIASSYGPAAKARTAVILRSGVAVKRNSRLGCWSQPVLWWNSRDGARQAESTVCAVEEADADAPQLFAMRFVAYRANHARHSRVKTTRHSRNGRLQHHRRWA